MQTTILKAASNFLLPVLLLFSIFILLRGHYLPGGRFRERIGQHQVHVEVPSWISDALGFDL